MAITAPPPRRAEIAASKGAAAIVIRSIGTDYHRNPHTGGTNWAKGVKPIPAAALTVPDAEQLERAAQARAGAAAAAAHAQVQGRRRIGQCHRRSAGQRSGAGDRLIGGHLDSWDLGTGAIDDAPAWRSPPRRRSGSWMPGTPRRTIRVVWFGAEEPGGFGGEAYFAKAHANERHVLAAESDFGADRVWKFDVNLPASAKPLDDRLTAALAPLGISRGRGHCRRRHRCRPAA
jgi:hypothetical protein